MNILWISCTLLPAPCKALNLPVPYTAGWISGMAEQIANSSDVKLAIAAVYDGSKVERISDHGILYYMLPTRSKRSYDDVLTPLWKDLCSDFKPDVIHIHGTEYPAGLVCMKACPDLNYVISVQGLISVYSRYYFGDICSADILRHITFRDLVRGDSLFQAKKKFEKRSKYEKEYIQRARHMIGRTRWDYAHVKAINPAVNYHFCNESLRSDFYKAVKWDVSQRKDYTIFCSQAYYPLKGAHQVLRAAAMLKKEFPEIQIRIAGYSNVRNTTLSEKLRLSGYGNYLRGLIKKYDLHKNVHFLGPLDEQQMIAEYQKAHVFVCPSSIENSPNSLGEAQLIGTPVIAAYVGGVPDMVTHDKTGLLYRFEEVEMLAEDIRCLFTDDRLAQRLSKGGIEVASKRHDKLINYEQMIQIYGEII